VVAVVGVSVVVGRSEEERADAHRVMKLVQNGVGTSELSAEEFGLLYLHYPELLPDVDTEVTRR
jgi:hypothetical protein